MEMIELDKLVGSSIALSVTVSARSLTIATKLQTVARRRQNSWIVKAAFDQLPLTGKFPLLLDFQRRSRSSGVQEIVGSTQPAHDTINCEDVDPGSLDCTQHALHLLPSSLIRSHKGLKVWRISRNRSAHDEQCLSRGFVLQFLINPRSLPLQRLLTCPHR
jgi:hypothetical protein